MVQLHLDQRKDCHVDYRNVPSRHRKRSVDVARSPVTHMRVATHSIYREVGGKVPVRRACLDRLDQWDVPHTLDRYSTSLGTTTVLSVGNHTDRPPVLLLPGAGLNAATTTELIGSLQKHHRVLVADIPGEPGMSSPRRPHRQADEVYSRWLDELIPRLSAEPVIVMGHALGAAIVLAATPSESITGVILVNPAGLAVTDPSARWRWLRAKWILRPSEETSTQLISYSTAPDYVPSSSLIRWYSMVSEYSFPGRQPRPVPRTRIRRWAGRMPVIVATGEHDRLLDGDRVRARARALLDVEVRSLPGCGHLSLCEAPQLVADLTVSMPPAQKEYM